MNVNIVRKTPPYRVITCCADLELVVSSTRALIKGRAYRDKTGRVVCSTCRVAHSVEHSAEVVWQGLLTNAEYVIGEYAPEPAR